MRKTMKNIWLYSFYFFIIGFLGSIVVNFNQGTNEASNALGYAYGVGWGLLAIVHLFVLIFTKKEGS